MTVLEEKVACRVCGKSVPAERIELDLKTCSSGCQRRLKQWKNPISRRAAQLLVAAGGPERVLWNDRALQERLDTDKAGASARLEELARAKGLEIAWSRSGYVHFVAKVSPERKARFLLTPEVRP